MTLTEFLLARIADDQRRAEAAGSEWWYPAEMPPMTMRKRMDEPTKIIIDSPRSLVCYDVCTDGMAQHIVTHDPERVLAECEAKRRIVERFAPRITGRLDGYAFDAEYILNTLAAVYSDHPDYREEWAI